jgi:oligopeptide transport system substrate-binding protein
MLRKFHVKSILLLGVIVLFSACTKKVNLDEKVLSLNVAAKVKGLDPINTGDTYSSNQAAMVYEGLLKYHYLKRPYTLVPNLAAEMPEVSKDGLTYTFKIRKGVKFHNNKCFPSGKGRELKASDFVYSIQRLADARNVSVGWWLLDDKIVGLNEWRDRNKKLEKTNYDDLDIEGLKALDDYTLQFKLKKPFPQFLFSLAMSYTYAVSREAVEFYDKEFLNNPVGTGPFVTGTYTQSNTIVYTKNPNFRDMFYPTEGMPGDKEKGLLKDAGKKLPLVKKVIYNILPEEQPRWLNFLKGKVDKNDIPKDDFQNVVTPSKGVTDTLAEKGIGLEISPDLDITYIVFNHDDPLFKDNVKLKQAMSLAYNTAESNTLFYNDTAILAQTPIPPGIGGYDENYKNPYMQYDVEKAKKLLAEAGYPGGKGLPAIEYETLSKTTSRQMAEFFKKQMEQIGVNIKINTQTWPQLTEKVKKRKAQMYGMAWLGDYPDAENFLQLIYGPNQAPGPNGANFDNPDFNKRFEKITKMQPGPERAKLYGQLAQEYSEKVPWILGMHRTSYVMKHSWLKNYKFSTFEYGNAQYWDVDLKVKKELINKL